MVADFFDILRNHSIGSNYRSGCRNTLQNSLPSPILSHLAVSTLRLTPQRQRRIEQQVRCPLVENQKNPLKR